MPTFGSLFSGCGAMDLGFQQAGWELEWQVEYDVNCQQVLRRHNPCVRILGDVHDVGRHNLNRVDMIVGGFPCTNISKCLNSTKTNFNGPESGLVREFSRIVEELNPSIIVIENVVGLMELWPLVEAEGMFAGYHIEKEVLVASHFGAYTRRKRAFVVGHLGACRGGKILDFQNSYRPSFRTGGAEDVLPMCLPWKGGVSLERLGACAALPR